MDIRPSIDLGPRSLLYPEFIVADDNVCGTRVPVRDHCVVVFDAFSISWTSPRLFKWLNRVIEFVSSGLCEGFTMVRYLSTVYYYCQIVHEYK